jgi:hypothetical protein
VNIMSIQTTKDDRTLGKADIASLVALHHRTVDALAGYATMVEKAEPEFKAIAEAFRALHAEQGTRLARMLAGLGHDVSPDGTLMGAVNVAVVSMRAAFDAIDADVMDAIRSGETYVLRAFEEAISANPDPAIRAPLQEMSDALGALLDRTQTVG